MSLRSHPSTHILVVGVAAAAAACCLTSSSSFHNVVAAFTVGSGISSSSLTQRQHTSALPTRNNVHRHNKQGNVVNVVLASANNDVEEGGGGDFDGTIGDFVSEETSSYVAGEALAREFSEQVRLRELQSGRIDENPSSMDGSTQKKFTGKKKAVGEGSSGGSTGERSAGFFKGRGRGSVFSEPAERVSKGGGPSSSSSMESSMSPRDRMLQNELEVASATNRFLVLPSFVAVLMIVGFVFVGVTGGITDGSERLVDTSEFNAPPPAALMDDVKVEFQMPVGPMSSSIRI